jgi:hypothetical protein
VTAPSYSAAGVVPLARHPALAYLSAIGSRRESSMRLPFLARRPGSVPGDMNP